MILIILERKFKRKHSKRFYTLKRYIDFKIDYEFFSELSHILHTIILKYVVLKNYFLLCVRLIK